MRFGAFVAPFHSPKGNPTLQLRRDVELAVHLDELGFDEIWYGEHHSGAYETIASPELMIAAAAEHTHRIRFGTGVNSVPYHHPYILADRIMQLDHMTRGRVMLGVESAEVGSGGAETGSSGVAAIAGDTTPDPFLCGPPAAPALVISSIIGR